MAAEETEGVLVICKLETYNMREFYVYVFEHVIQWLVL